ncbi:hypothetical protein [Streptomyces cinereoruber]|uniref:hypothetical protein n=1 Tax=Streptomyces cinereoruber TaxID=67260 RepID=UPI0036473DD2
MDSASTAAIIGATLGAGGATLGAWIAMLGARAQARAQVEVARIQAESASRTEAISRRRAAFSEFGAAVEDARMQFVYLEEVWERHKRAPDEVLEREHGAKVEILNRSIRDLQSKEWALRFTLSAAGQGVVTEVVQSVFQLHKQMDRRWIMIYTGEDEEFLQEEGELSRQLFNQLHAKLYDLAESIHKELPS